MIEDYSFGKITVDKKTYVKDLLILGEKVICPWIREKGHFLSVQDLREVKDYSPEFLVIGTGFFGMMKVERSVFDQFSSLGCEVLVFYSVSAAAKFNEISEKHKTAAALHLTC